MSIKWDYKINFYLYRYSGDYTIHIHTQSHKHLTSDNDYNSFI